MGSAVKINKNIKALHVLTTLLHGMWEMACAPGRHNERMVRIEHLRGLSDEKLAERGLTRADIVRHVYRGMPTT